MANPLHHAISSSRRWGGDPDLYLPIHEWFDVPKGWLCDSRSRAIRHHAEGIAEAVELFKPVWFHLEKCSDRPHHRTCKIKQIPVRWVAEQHVLEDLGRIPNAADYLRCMRLEPWMTRSRKLSKEQEEGR